MKKICLLFFIIFCLVTQAQTGKEISDLKEAYLKATTGSDSLDFQKQFFDAFPKTFVAFKNTFGYMEHNDPQNAYAGALSADSEKYIALFFHLKNVPDAEFYTKLINLGTASQLDASLENQFQTELRKKVLQNPQLTLELLKNEADKDIETFWIFFFSRRHSAYKEIPEKLKGLKSTNQNVYGRLEKGFKMSQN